MKMIENLLGLPDNWLGVVISVLVVIFAVVFIVATITALVLAISFLVKKTIKNWEQTVHSIRNVKASRIKPPWIKKISSSIKASLKGNLKNLGLWLSSIGRKAISYFTLPSNKKHELKHKVIFYFITVSVVCFFIASVIAVIASDDSWVNLINLPGIILALEVLYFIGSLRSIGPDKKGVLLLFGKPIEKVEPGLTFVPFLIMGLRIETSLIIQNELPCEPEKIWRVKDDQPDQKIPDGYFPPIRITFGPSKKIKNKNHPDFVGLENPYDKQITAEVTPVISWRITDMKIFVGTIGTVERTIKQIEDVAIAKFASNFAKITPALALKTLDKHSDELKTAIEGRVKGWGIEVVSAQIKPIGFSHKLNQSVIDVAHAEQTAKATVITAGATATKTRTEKTAENEMLEGNLKAIASGREAWLKAEAVGVEALAKQTGTPEGKIALWLETMREGFEKSNHTIIPGGDFFSAVSSIQALLQATATKGGTI